MISDGTPHQHSTISRRLWLDAQPTVYESLHHPFIRALGDGSLKKEAFQSYLTQDYFYLTAFTKALSAATCKAAAISEDAVTNVKELLDGVREELKLHSSYAAEWGVQLSKSQQPNPASLKYTRFLLRLAEGPQSLVEVLVSMAPCARLYGFLGCQLARSPRNMHIATSAAGLNTGGIAGMSDHPYSHWIKTYSSPAYLSTVAKQEACIDRYGAEMPYERLRALYCTAMGFEAEFFGEHTSAPQRPPVALLAVDFDETCSQSDTIGTILDTTIDAAAAKTSGSSEAKTKLTSIRDQLVADYSSGHAALMAQIMPEDGKGASSYDDEWLAAFTSRLSAFDRAMNKAVEDSSILASATAADLRRAGSQIGLQDGCTAVLQQAVKQRVSCHVISVNWSSQLVRAALEQGSSIINANETSSHTPSGPTIHANDLAVDDAGMTTGHIEGRVVCAEDKRSVFETVLLDVASKSGSQEGISVYVGDSPSDLSALMAADFGIVIGSNALLRRVAAAAGIRLEPLVSAGMARQAPLGVLFEASGWPEIGAFLFGRAPDPAPTGSAQPDPSQKVPRVLSVAGSDSGGGAGIQADLKTCAALGAFGMTAITALTIQNTHGVDDVHTPPARIVAAQMDAVLSDIGADAIKTGMLANDEIVEAVAKRIASIPAGDRPPVVVDPVLVSTSGASLGSSGIVAALKRHLLPLTTLLTPNLPEASALLEGRHIHDVADMKAAAEELHALGPQYVLIKGGHLLSSHLDTEQQAADVLYDGTSHHVLSEPAIRTGNTHGTGCTLATAAAAGLAKGVPMVEAVQQAKRYLTQALLASQSLAIGSGGSRPFNHAYATANWQGSTEASSAHGNMAAMLQDVLRLYAVTDQACNDRQGRTIEDAVKAALEGGARCVQLRLKDTDGITFQRQAQTVVSACRARGALAIINDRADIALATNAHGVHVGQEDMAAADVRRLIGPSRILGVSVKTLEQAKAAAAAGADYLGAGALFPTSTKQTDVITEGTLRDICAAVTIPVVAIGGLTAANAGRAIEAGCKGVAVVSALFAQHDVTKAARDILEAVESAIARRQANWTD